MKKLFYSVVALCHIALVAKTQQVQSAKAIVDKATVYFSGATLTHTADFAVKPGMNDLVFENVSPMLNVKSMQASGKGNIIIMDVKYNVKMSEQLPPLKTNDKYDKILKQINDSISDLGFTIDELNERYNALQSEKNILLNNRLIKGDTHKDTLALFTEAIDYLRQRLENINTESFKVKRALYSYNGELAELQLRQQQIITAQSQLSASNKGAVNVHQVIVTVMAETEGPAKLTVSYFVNGASWAPSYDIRANGADKNMSITQKAHVTQNTGIDWNNTLITLATASPNQSITKPQLNPVYITYYMNMIREKKPQLAVQMLEKNNDEPVTTGAGNSVPKDVMDDAKAMYAFTDMYENLVQTEYNIKLKYNIPADGKEHLLVVQNKEVNADYKFSAVPKIDGNAYLIASVTDWSELNLIAGPSRVYFDGAYVGQSTIDPAITTDTMSISLGRDKSIVMQRKKLKDKTRSKFFGEDKTISYAFEITIKNTKSMTVDLNLEDQIPVSNNKEVEVTLVDASKATHYAETGKLEWNLQLKPGETKKLTVSYEVKMPKNKTLAGL